MVVRRPPLEGRCRKYPHQRSSRGSAASYRIHVDARSHTPMTHRDGRYLEAVPAAMDAAVLAKLIGLINTGTKECDSTPCLDTGIIATKWLMEVLSNRGRTDVGLQLAFKTDFPSWGYMASMTLLTPPLRFSYARGHWRGALPPLRREVGALPFLFVLSVR